LSETYMMPRCARGHERAAPFSIPKFDRRVEIAGAASLDFGGFFSHPGDAGGRCLLCYVNAAGFSVRRDGPLPFKRCCAPFLDPRLPRPTRRHQALSHAEARSPSRTSTPDRRRDAADGSSLPTGAPGSAGGRQDAGGDRRPAAMHRLEALGMPLSAQAVSGRSRDDRRTRRLLRA